MKAVAFLLLIPAFLLSLPTLQAQEEEFGLASYYSDDFHGRKTAYGDYYDKAKLTAAHKKYPYGTKIRITRLDNNKSVVATVTDKGPYIKGRVVDLSRRAAENIGLVQDGVAQVKVELVSRGKGQEDVAATRPKRTTPERSSTPAPSRTRPADYDDTPTTPPAREVTVVRVPDEQLKSPTRVVPAPERGTATPAPGEVKYKLVQQDYTQYGLYKIVLQKPDRRGFGVQVASLSNYENVLKQVADLQAKWFDNILISVERGGVTPVYKVILGPFPDEKTAQNYESSLQKKYKIKGFTVNLSEIQY